MNITEFFKWMIDSEEYALGDYMCWMVESVFECGAQPSECKLSEQDVVKHINDFLRYINDQYEVNLCDDDEEPVSYAMATVLSSARSDVIRRAGIQDVDMHKDETTATKVCLEIYSNWDKRFEIVETYIKQGK